MAPGAARSQPGASGQQSAFSHPPHMIASSSRTKIESPPPRSYPNTSSYTQSTSRPGTFGTSWSPMAASNSALADDDDEDDEIDEDDEEENGEEENGVDGHSNTNDDTSTSSNKKRKRDGQGNMQPSAAAVTVNADDTATSSKGEDGVEGKKIKPRGAKACKNCRRLKMRCVGAQDGPPCDRCKHTNHACIFEESNRGKRTGKSHKTEAMAASLRKMEATMNNLIQSLKDPSSAFTHGAGMLTRTPSPVPRTSKQQITSQLHPQTDRWRSSGTADGLGRTMENNSDRSFLASADVDTSLPDTQSDSLRVQNDLHNSLQAASPGGNHINPLALGHSDSNMRSSVIPSKSTTKQMETRFAEPEDSHRKTRHSSPRLHSLPDNTLNPLGLLAEASLHNLQRVRRLSNRNRPPDDAARSALRAASIGVQSSQGNASSPGAASNHSLAAMTDAASHTSADVNSALMNASNGRQHDKALTASVEAHSKDNKISNSSDPANVKDSGGLADEDKYHLGVASEVYFKPGPMTILPLRRIVIERDLSPELLTHGIVSSEEFLELFQIFFHHCGQHVVLLDPEWHTPTMICSRSPFLFTAICTIAAKFYAKRPDLHLKCLKIVRKSAYVIMSRGFKSVEIVQGFLLLTLWNTPAERFEEDRTWMFSGVAIRMATDMNLHRKSVASLPGNPHPDDPVVKEREREIINRERTWLTCFIIDRNISGQMGKPWTIREDWIIRNSRHWCMQSLSQPWDLGISALVELLRLTSRQLDSLYSSTTSVSGLNTDIDYSSLLRVYNEQLEEWHSTWKSRGFFASPHQRDSDLHQDGSISEKEKEVVENVKSANTAIPPADDEDHRQRTLHFITKQAPLRYNYAILILNSFGLQHAVDFPLHSGLDKGLYLTKCLQAAKNIVFAARDGMKPILAYSTDTLFVAISYACVFLLKLTRPVFSAYVNEEEVLAVVVEGANLLESVALHHTHTPALYASFLRALLQSRMERTATNRSGATTPHRSRAVSPLAEAEELADDKMGTNQEGDGDPINPVGDMPFSSNHMQQPSSFTAEQAALLPGYSGYSDAVNASGAGSNSLNGYAIDQLLNESFWGSLLPPGFGGPLDGLATGSIEMFAANNHHASGSASMSPSNGQTRASTPSMLNTFGPNVSLNFSSGSLS